ncbi:hypothetical protein CONCODRAFT_3296 [Conidiobolus coronatus NRRL 28638]|uniref:G-protein coupled receptors family 1 profile domain-containing protein n=1 Tax=Conidiobolus coronatus (strain ATCC 28846 / CBS 209.66 / NRRL 28638) TaxID=796925 RepID=A0A137PFF3_CONC2|nr:hypothetical protein CONCODRAFT_3296 [Conidiobolus coronatus NRRL 28638]|eukprot:KXN73736.1 hypothetical protein CONCODRAFT_3296 [Conidiobolus coronatus NRRL 28638]
MLNPLVPRQLSLVLHPIGMACSILVLVSIIGLAIINKKLVNRMTVRLIAAIAFTDLLAHVGEFYSVSNAKLPLGSTTCQVVIGFRLFSRAFYCFTNLAICFHLYRSLVLLKKSTWKFEVTTWIATAVVVVVFTCIYGGLGAMTGVNNKKGCNPGADDKTLNTVFYLIIGIVNIVTIAAGIFTTVACRRNLNKWINAFTATQNENNYNQESVIKYRKKMAERSFLYPLSTCITLPFEALFFILNAFNVYVLELTIPNILGTGLSGVLTAIAFAIDPATHQAFRAAYRQLAKGSSDDKLPEYQYTESNNDIALGTAK